MSKTEHKSFWDEVQEKYVFTEIEFTPAWYLNAGMTITLGLQQNDKRSNCPMCNKRPIVNDQLLLSLVPENKKLVKTEKIYEYYGTKKRWKCKEEESYQQSVMTTQQISGKAQRIFCEE